MPKPKEREIAEKAEPFIKRIESLDADRESERGESMARCRSIRDDIKIVYGEAKDAGLAVKPLKAAVKRRKLERKIAALPAEFDIDESAQYDALAVLFAGTPFGDHAKAQADRKRPKAKEADAEEESRPDEEALAKFAAQGHADPVDALAH